MTSFSEIETTSKLSILFLLFKRQDVIYEQFQFQTLEKKIPIEDFVENF